MSVDWNFATCWEAIADAQPDRPALVQGERTAAGPSGTTASAAWPRRSRDLGLEPRRQGRELPLQLDRVHGGRLRHVEVRRRAGQRELPLPRGRARSTSSRTPTPRSCSSTASLGEHVAKVRGRGPDAARRSSRSTTARRSSTGALRYEELIGVARARAARTRRSGDDLYILYTGGTTGMPKGVMWRNEDLFMSLVPYVLRAGRRAAPRRRSGGRRPRSRRGSRPRARTPVHLPASPLMHGTGFMSSLQALTMGGTIVTLESRNFDADELWRAVAAQRRHPDGDRRRRVRQADGRARSSRPRPRASRTTCRRSAHDQLRRDVDGRGEAGAHGARRAASASTRSARARASGSRARSASRARRRRPRSSRSASTPRCSPRTAARSSPAPTRSACSRSAARSRSATTRTRRRRRATFPTFGGQRYSIPGDWARVAADGTIELLGRGSVSINTGGEKVFPEEVEEAVKLHPAVVDAIVVGVPDDRFGEVIAAVVELGDGDRAVERRDRRLGARPPRRLQAPAPRRRSSTKVHARAERQGRLRVGQAARRGAGRRLNRGQARAEDRAAEQLAVEAALVLAHVRIADDLLVAAPLGSCGARPALGSNSCSTTVGPQVADAVAVVPLRVPGIEVGSGRATRDHGIALAEEVDRRQHRPVRDVARRDHRDRGVARGGLASERRDLREPRSRSGARGARSRGPTRATPASVTPSRSAATSGPTTSARLSVMRAPTAAASRSAAAANAAIQCARSSVVSSEATRRLKCGSVSMLALTVAATTTSAVSPTSTTHLARLGRARRPARLPTRGEDEQQRRHRSEVAVRVLEVLPRVATDEHRVGHGRQHQEGEQQRARRPAVHERDRRQGERDRELRDDERAERAAPTIEAGRQRDAFDLQV